MTNYEPILPIGSIDVAPILYQDGDKVTDIPMTVERIVENMPLYQSIAAKYRRNLDKLCDLFITLSGENCHFRLYHYQRIFLRVAGTHKRIFFYFSRETSKSFSMDLAFFLIAIAYPGIKIAVAAESLQQGGQILYETGQDIIKSIPALGNEIEKFRKDKDLVTITFKNGSIINNLVTKQTRRGLRRNIMGLEEVRDLDGEGVQSILLPMLGVKRRMPNGQTTVDPIIDQVFAVTTPSDSHSSYAYESAINTLAQMIAYPETAIILGGSYMIPVLGGLQGKDYINSVKREMIDKPQIFAREYGGEWTDGDTQVFFSPEIFSKNQVIQIPEFEADRNINANDCYILSIDVGLYGDASEILIWKRIYRKNEPSLKMLVGIETLQNVHFKEQAIRVKELYNRYLPKAIVIDTNGNGAGLLEELVMQSHTDRYDRYLPPFGLINDEKGYYKTSKTNDTIRDIIYQVKANAGLNTEIYSIFQSELYGSRLRFLIDEHAARIKLETSRAKQFQQMTAQEKSDYLIPFINTSFLKAQLGNLDIKREGAQLSLSKRVKSMKKDKCSAAFYGIYYIKKELDDKERKKMSGSLSSIFGAQRGRQSAGGWNSKFNELRQHYGKIKRGN